jgi:putative urate catabolism protein
VTSGYPRDLAGYGPVPPDPRWPGAARVAVSVVVNWEEGGERNILHGDDSSEAAVNDVVDAVPRLGARDPRVESMFEYGSRAGVWRLLRLLRERDLPATVFAVGMAVERSPGIVRRMAAEGHEICAHGYRWIDYQALDAETERAHVARAVDAIEQATGRRPRGWYTGRTSENTRRLVVEEGGFRYDSDDYSDDLPFWTAVAGRQHLVIPYTLDVNDMRFVGPAGFATGGEFFDYARDTFDQLYAEGASAPKMMSIGLHCRLAGRPGRARAVGRLLDHIRGHDQVWFARRIDIARHWSREHPPPGPVGQVWPELDSAELDSADPDSADLDGVGLSAGVGLDPLGAAEGAGAP